MYSLDKADGSPVHWYQNLPPTFYSSPLVDGNTVYVGGANGVMYALNTVDGSIKWHRETAPNAPINYSSPIRDPGGTGVLYVGAGGGISAVRESDGSTLWRQTSSMESGASNNNVTMSPTETPAALYVGSLDNKLVKLNADTGSLIWAVDVGTDIYSTPVIGGDYPGNVYITAGDTLYAVDFEGHILWEYDAYTGVLGSPAISNGVIYVASSSGTLDAVNLSNGSRIWRYELSIMPYAGPNPNTPVFFDGGSVIYIAGKTAYSEAAHGIEAVYLGGS